MKRQELFEYTTSLIEKINSTKDLTQPIVGEILKEALQKLINVDPNDFSSKESYIVST